jgi:hypothetical protein
MPYKVPKVDYKYHIKETPIITREKSPSSFISQVIKRANSTVDPRKYSTIVDWRVRSHQNLIGKFERQKRETMMAKLMKEKEDACASEKDHRQTRIESQLI